MTGKYLRSDTSGFFSSYFLTELCIYCVFMRHSFGVRWNGSAMKSHGSAYYNERMHRESLLGLLREYAERHPRDLSTTARFIEFVLHHPRCFERDLWAGHVTGSAWLVDGSGQRVLLTHHRKLGRWLQLGGHSDGDPRPLEVAIQEAREESGLDAAPLSRQIFDLDIHEIPARKSDPAHLHYDVRFALQVTGSEDFRVSTESLDLAWVSIDRLARYTDEASMLRMARKWQMSDLP